jgi:hypothetical protein
MAVPIYQNAILDIHAFVQTIRAEDKIIEIKQLEVEQWDFSCKKFQLNTHQ